MAWVAGVPRLSWCVRLAPALFLCRRVTANPPDLDGQKNENTHEHRLARSGNAGGNIRRAMGAMSADFRTPRLFTPEPFAVGGRLRLTPAQTHYLKNVLRRKPGDDVLVFNGRDGEGEGRISALGRDGAEIEVARLRRPQTSTPDLWLVFAPVKKAAMDNLVAKATELGVDRLVPVWTQHTQARRLNLDRLEAQAIEAAEQSDRLSVPGIAPPRPLLDVLSDWPGERRLLVCDETGGGRPILDVLDEMGSGPTAFLAGPEGGFAISELDPMRKLPFSTAIGLGPRVLRADTAAIAALSCWQARLGDWHEQPAFRGTR